MQPTDHMRENTKIGSNMLSKLSISSGLTLLYSVSLKGSNKQAIAAALKELEETGLLEKVIIKKKPLHIEYYLTKQGHSLIPVLQQLENIG